MPTIPTDLLDLFTPLIRCCDPVLDSPGWVGAFSTPGALLGTLERERSGAGEPRAVLLERPFLRAALFVPPHEGTSYDGFERLRAHNRRPGRQGCRQGQGARRRDRRQRRVGSRRTTAAGKGRCGAGRAPRAPRS